MSDIDLKSRYDIGWFSAYDTLKGMVILYGYSKVLDALMEIGNLTPLAPDAAKAEPYFDPELPEEYIEGVIYYQNRRAGKA
jgi:hypothetical protein